MTPRTPVLMAGIALFLAFAPPALAEETPLEEIPYLGPAWTAECEAERVCIHNAPEGSPEPISLPPETPLMNTGSIDPGLSSCDSPEPGVECWSTALDDDAPDATTKESLGDDEQATRTVPAAGILVIGLAMVGAALLARGQK